MDAASLSVPRWLRCAEHAPAQLAAGETLLLPVRTAGLAPALARRGLRCRPGKRSSSRAGSAARWRPYSLVRSGSTSVSPRSSIHCWRSAGRPERMSILACGSE
jgi:hypothetical protein